MVLREAVGVSVVNVQPLLDAINDRKIVSGLTHDLYRYPARFSPLFARAAIELFTKPGDTILDPFMGSGSTAAAGNAVGVHCIGVEKNSEYFDAAPQSIEQLTKIVVPRDQLTFALA